MRMKDFPKKVQLRDKSSIRLRPMVKEDEKALLRFFRRLPARDRLHLHDDVTDPKVVKRFCDTIDYEVVLPLIAIKQRRIYAGASLHQARYGWSRHVGEIRMSVDPKMRRKGLASLLTWELLRVAIDRELEIISAKVPAKLTHVIEGLQKFGFRREAELIGHVTDLKGKKHNLIILTNDAIHIWKQLKGFLRDRAFVGF
jgi:GNAT superfamily N-acetyltransferase